MSNQNKGPHLEEETSRLRKLRGPVGLVVKILSVILPIFTFLYIMQILVPLGIFIYAGSYNAIVLALALILLFFLVPASKKAPRDHIPWYDVVLAGLGAVGSFYIAVVYEDVLLKGGIGVTPAQIALGFITIITLMEATRRTMGWAMVVVALFFLIHAKFTYLFPGLLHGPEYSFSRVMNYLYLSDQGIFGSTLDIAARLIVAFMTFGGFLTASGGGEQFIKLSLALLGHVRGAGAKVALVASSLMGMLTGSALSEVGIIGVFTIPLMKKGGYSREFAAAVESVAATGGSLVPPVLGAVAFIMADYTGLGYGKIALAAVIPALLYYLALYFQIDLRAAKLKLAGLPRAELPSLGEALRGSLILFLPIALLVYLLMVVQYEATTAVYYAIALLLVLSAFNKANRLNLSKIIFALERASQSLLDIIPLCAMAGIIVGSVALTGLGVNLAGMLVSLSGGSLLILAILTGAASYLLGMGVNQVITYLILSVLVAPAMVQAGLSVLVAHFFIFYMGISMQITPPYAPVPFLAASIAEGKPFPTAFQAMRLGIVAFLVPFITVFNPALLLGGPVEEVAIAVVTAIVAVYALAVGLEGYCLVALSWLERILWLAGGLLLFIPSVNLILPGGVLLAVGVLLQLRKRAHSHRPSEVEMGQSQAENG